MARFGEHAVWFAFTSDRFDHLSELPPEANAGNRFYGRDVASFISAGLAGRGFDASFFDEDWGWQTHARRPGGLVLEISIYHNLDQNRATEDEWALMLRSLHKERRLGIARLRETEVDADAVSTLEDLFRAAGVALRRTPPHESHQRSPRQLSPARVCGNVAWLTRPPWRSLFAR